MNLKEIQALTDLRLSTEAGERPWLGAHYFRKGGTDLWVQLESGRLRSFVISSVNGLETTRLSPRKDLCSGVLSFRLRIYLPEQLEGSRVLLDGVEVPHPYDLLVEVALPVGEHDIRIEHRTYAPIARRITVNLDDRGDLDLRVAQTDLLPLVK